ncbi:TetR/AcrR family transcriptional regulator [Streptomyces albipurpureus]|uniref:TetR/AcrR family transcriptional regulator n=1 Tax=Streptomyces albipurpureus TaxID=2897419 RepID=A0ABT0V0B8_9ACTN|nr:TetR/AcrR family transcriptional regulator [Streptomyces sp. CWNU-1]MCM2394288.1 TetR/AcrR family transcriptional regulator [Streptomyces sp. CWNU-1]
MPLPRYHRLPAETRAAILAVARAHFARDGKEAASFNRIIAEAKISKTSAYHYFDGKDDLFDAVADDAAERTLTALGPWREVSTAAELWQQLTTGTGRLRAQLREHPDDRAVLAEMRQGRDGGRSDEPAGDWMGRLIANGVRIEVIDPGPDAELVATATRGVFDALDRWALEHPEASEESIVDALTTLLARLWGTTVSR